MRAGLYIIQKEPLITMYLSSKVSSLLMCRLFWGFGDFQWRIQEFKNRCAGAGSAFDFLLYVRV